jgi:hypothetical protein
MNAVECPTKHLYLAMITCRVQDSTLCMEVQCPRQANDSLHDIWSVKLNLCNACYHSVQKRLSFWQLSKNVKFEIYKTDFAHSFIWV